MSARASVTPVVSFLVAVMLVCPVVVLAVGGGGTAPDYGDLLILYRDAYGVPVLSPVQDVTDPETGLPVQGGECLQPVAAAGVDIVDALGESINCEKTPDGLCLIPLDQYACTVLPEFAGYTQEVEFERINVARSPEDVLARQLEDALVNLATADCISLDPAGRLVYQTLDINDSDGDTITDEYLSKTIDSPVQNLAIYKELILTGQLGDPAIDLPDPWGFLDTGAAALGAASSKEGAVNVDEVVYLNRIMGLSDPETPTMLDPKTCIYPRQEVKGVVVKVEKCFLDYSDHHYLRARTYRLLPDPAYIPEESPKAGGFEYLDFLRYDYAGNPLFRIFQRPIRPVVFPNEETTTVRDFLPGFTDGNIGGFAQAADDARAVIEFMHSHPVLSGYETPLPECGGPHETAYNVSINPVSGFQVPVMMVVNEDGREVIVTVGNSGPDAASGSVTVVGEMNGTPIMDDQTFHFDELASGASQGWAFQVVATEAGTIDWEATVTAPYDVFSADNTVTGTTEVLAGGSGEGE